MTWYEKIDEISESIIKLDQKLGVKKIIQYLFLVLLFIGIVNIRSVTKWAIETVTTLSEELHAEKMERRDQLLASIVPELHELLGATGADRVLYLEYHNSKENLIGIPFKYIDLVSQTSKYGVSLAPMNTFRDINVGNLSLLYEDLKLYKIIACRTDNMTEFTDRYQGIHEYIEDSDKSTQQVFISIPGIKQPVGMIILEWVNPNKNLDMSRIMEESTIIVHTINGLILQYR